MSQESWSRRELDSLLAVDRRIRFVVLCDLEGRTKLATVRKGVVPMEPQARTKLILAQAAIGNDMARSHNGYHGPVRMVVILREKLMLILFSIFDGFLLVTAEPDLPLEKAADLGRKLDLMGAEPSERELSPNITLSNERWMAGDLR